MRLFDLLGQRLAIVRIAGKRPGTHDQPALLSNCQAGLDTELVGLARLAFADTLDFRRVQCISLFLSLRRRQMRHALSSQTSSSDCRSSEALCSLRSMSRSNRPSRSLALEHAA